MKRIRKIMGILIILLTVFGIYDVNAANYEMKELIPKDIKTTIKGNNLLYKDIEYKKGKIVIGELKNLSDEKKSITISIGIFNSKKRNIGIINYCSTEDALEPKASSMNYQISIDEEVLGDDYTIGDIKYYAVLSENSNCRLGGAKEFEGKRIKDVNAFEANELSSSALLLINIIKVITAGLVVLFLYKFLFTKAYRNVDNEDVRADFDYINKQKAKERELELKRNPPKPKPVKKTKTDKVLEQEQKEKENERKDNSNLHNFYK